MNTRAHLDICMYWLFVVECCVVWCTAVIATVTGENIRVCVAGQRQDRTNNWEPLFNVFMFFFSFFFLSLTLSFRSPKRATCMYVRVCMCCVTAAYEANSCSVTPIAYGTNCRRKLVFFFSCASAFWISALIHAIMHCTMQADIQPISTPRG